MGFGSSDGGGGPDASLLSQSCPPAAPVIHSSLPAGSKLKAIPELELPPPTSDPAEATPLGSVEQRPAFMYRMAGVSSAPAISYMDLAARASSAGSTGAGGGAAASIGESPTILSFMQAGSAESQASVGAGGGVSSSGGVGGGRRGSGGRSAGRGTPPRGAPGSAYSSTDATDGHGRPGGGGELDAMRRDAERAKKEKAAASSGASDGLGLDMRLDDAAAMPFALDGVDDGPAHLSGQKHGHDGGDGGGDGDGEEDELRSRFSTMNVRGKTIEFHDDEHGLMGMGGHVGGVGGGAHGIPGAHSGRGANGEDALEDSADALEESDTFLPFAADP